MEEEQEEKWEERSLNLLEDSKIDQELSDAKTKKKAKKKHKLKWMKRPMAVSEVIIEFLDEDLRENALRALANFLLDRWEENPDDCHQAGLFLFYSCSTLTVLLQELVEFMRQMTGNAEITLRTTKRLANVLTLFQSIAANGEIRPKFIQTCIPNFLLPIIAFKSDAEAMENVRAISLSVIGILCQGRDSDVIAWATENDVAAVCLFALKMANELSKVIAMHILEYIMRDPFGQYFVCDPEVGFLEDFVETLAKLAVTPRVEQESSPRLIFHVLRCLVLLCVHPRGLRLVNKYLPTILSSEVITTIAEEFAVIQSLRCQLLLNVGI